jgi:hypothetical protein
MAIAPTHPQTTPIPSAVALGRRGWRWAAIPAASSLHPGRRARALARLRASALDRALVQGADPAASAALAARAVRLTRRRTRERLADAVQRLADYDSGARLRVRPARAVRVNRPELRELAAVLRSPGPVYAGGVAAARLMLRDGAGPAYTDRHGEALTCELQAIRSALGA